MSDPLNLSTATFHSLKTKLSTETEGMAGKPNREQISGSHSMQIIFTQTTDRLRSLYWDALQEMEVRIGQTQPMQTGLSLKCHSAVFVSSNCLPRK